MLGEIFVGSWVGGWVVIGFVLLGRVRGFGGDGSYVGRVFWCNGK